MTIIIKKQKIAVPGIVGATGPQGPIGPAGPGVPVGGIAGQILAKIDGTDYNTEWIQNNVTSDWFYWGDPSVNGSWREGIDGDNLIKQRRESGSWVTKSTLTP